MVEAWRLVPAVGEKKSEDIEGVAFGGVPPAPAPAPPLPPPPPLEGKGLSGAAERRSRDMVLEAPTDVYRPLGPCSSDLESARFCASAARLTLR